LRDPILREETAKREKKKVNQPDKTLPKNIFPLLILIFSAILIIALSVLFYFSFYAPTADEKIKYAIALVLSGVFAPIVFFLLFIYGLNYARTLKIRGGDHWMRWEYPKDSGKGDVYFCNEGVYDSDKPYGALDTFGSRFLGAEIPSDDPSVIRFTSLQYTGSRSFTQSERTREVPIPPGKEEEAEKIVLRFQEYLGRSSTYTKDQWRYVLPLLAVILLWCFLIFQFVIMPAGEEMKKERNQQAKELRHKLNVKEITPLWNQIRQTLEPKIEQLKTLPDGKLTAKEAGFDENLEVLAVLHGHCPAKNEFYVSVVLKYRALRKPIDSDNETGAFNYTTTTPFPTQPTEYFCKPPIQDYFENGILLSDGWIYGEIILRPYLPKPGPPANSPTNKIEK
jgi:hypothetical protein